MNERGSMTLEVMLVLPLVLIVLMAAVEVIAATGTQLELVAAARESVRVAATTPDPGRAAEAGRAVLNGTPARISVRRPHVVGEQAEVVVTYEKPLVTPLLGGLTVPLRARAVMVVER